jgi:hypothetical protein
MGLEGHTFYMILTNVKLQFSNQLMKNHILSTIQGGMSNLVPISSRGSSSAYGYSDGNDYANTIDVLEEDNMSTRAGIKPGEACLSREVAAYLLDEKGFSGVPMMTLVEVRHPAFHYNGSMLKLNQGGAAIGSHSIIPSTSLSMSMTSTSFSNTTGTGLSTSSLTSGSASASPSTSTTISVSSTRKKKVGSCQEFVPSEQNKKMGKTATNH